MRKTDKPKNRNSYSLERVNIDWLREEGERTERGASHAVNEAVTQYRLQRQDK